MQQPKNKRLVARAHICEYILINIRRRIHVQATFERCFDIDVTYHLLVDCSEGLGVGGEDPAVYGGQEVGDPAALGATARHDLGDVDRRVDAVRELDHCVHGASGRLETERTQSLRPRRVEPPGNRENSITASTARRAA